MFCPPWSVGEPEAPRGSVPHPRSEQEGQSRFWGDSMAPDSTLCSDERHRPLPKTLEVLGSTGVIAYLLFSLCGRCIR